MPLADLDANHAPERVVKDDGAPLLFAHKAKGITVLSDSLVFVIHDDDRVLGREDVTDPETQFSRGAHQAAYTLVSLSVVVPQTLPESGGAADVACVWLIALGGLVILLGLTRRPCKSS